MSENVLSHFAMVADSVGSDTCQYLLVVRVDMWTLEGCGVTTGDSVVNGATLSSLGLGDTFLGSFAPLFFFKHFFYFVPIFRHFWVLLCHIKKFLHF